MVDLLLQNAVPYRKRSPSDFFLDNGLALLNTSFAQAGIDAQVKDWANQEFFASISDTETSLAIAGLLKEGKISDPEYLRLQKKQDTTIRKNMNIRNSEIAEEIRESNVPVFGEKTFYGDAWKNSTDLFRDVRDRSPETIIVAGGPQVSVWREKIFSNSNADLFVIGEGERTLEQIVNIRKSVSTKQKAMEIIKSLAKKGQIYNLMFKDQGSIIQSQLSRVAINQKPFPTYDFLSLDDLLPIEGGKSNIHVIIDSLGCPWNKCYQCDHKQMYNGYFPRSPELVAEEMKAMTQRGVGFFRYAGSGATLEHQVKIANEINKKGLNVEYSAFMRGVPGAREKYGKLVDAFSIMVESGLTCVGMGGESGNDAVNIIFNKGVTSEDVEYTKKAYEEAGKNLGKNVDFVLYMMFPTTTADHTSHDQIEQDNIDFIQRVNPTSAVISPLAAFNGAEVYVRKANFGVKVDQNFDQIMPLYEYTSYIPKEYWRPFEYHIEELNFDQIIGKVISLTQQIKDVGIPTDITDEQVIFARGSGFQGREGLTEFYQKTIVDMVSCGNLFLPQIYQNFNVKSRELALSNKRT